MKVTKKYGTWPSPVTSNFATKGGFRLGGMAFENRTKDGVFYVEGRPSVRFKRKP